MCDRQGTILVVPQKANEKALAAEGNVEISKDSQATLAN
jgi:hypothetical protein